MRTRGRSPQDVIHFVSAPCSTGKTTAACHYIAASRSVANYLYVAPSLELLNQTSRELTLLGVEPTAITSETHPRHVKGAIVRYLNSAPQIGAVLLVTWKAYIELPYFNRKSDWTVIVDEVPSVDRFHPYMVPRHGGVLSKHLTLRLIENQGLALVEAKDRKRLKRLLDGPRDQVDDLFRDLFNDVLSLNHSVYVDRPSWNRIIDEGDVSKEHEANKVYLLSMLRPEALLGAKLLGANVEDTLLYHWFRQKGVVFKPDPVISSSLRASPASLGERLRISYFLQGRSFSKYLGNKAVIGGRTVVGGETIFDSMDALAASEFGNQSFLYIPNKHRRSIIDDLPNARAVSVACQGLNGLQDYHNLYFSAALNREPKHFAMLASLGLRPNLVHQATAHEAVYQAVMRTSLRDPEAREAVHVIVPDHASAERLGALLGSKNIARLGNLSVRQNPRLTPTEKSRRQRFVRLKTEIFLPQDIPDSSINEDGMTSGKFDGETNLTCSLTFHKNMFANSRDQFRVETYQLQDFIGELRETAKTLINRKDEAFLWNPAVFNASRGDGYRTQSNFIRSSFLVLDFDGGTLSPEEFEEIFWSSARGAGRHSFITCNSFSRSPAAPNKFRVIFPYRQPAQSIAEHKAAYAYIVTRLEEAGHTPASAQLDPACKSGVQSFWIPSTNRDYREMAFFHTFGTKTVELKRYALDPAACRHLQDEDEKQVAGKPINAGDKSYLADEIEAAEHQLRSMTSGRHYLFFKYGVLLAKADYDKSQIHSKLREIAGSETKMLTKVPGIIKSLTSYGWL